MRHFWREDVKPRRRFDEISLRRDRQTVILDCRSFQCHPSGTNANTIALFARLLPRAMQTDIRSHLSEALGLLYAGYPRLSVTNQTIRCQFSAPRIRRGVRRL